LGYKIDEMRKFLPLLAITILLFACSEPPADATLRIEEEIDRDIKEAINDAEEAELNEQEVDSIVEEVLSDEALEVVTEKAELKVLSKVTFCDCIKKQKTLDDRLMETEDDVEMDKIMAEMDELIEGECKNLMADNSTSPEDREERKLKIQGCLGQ
jgi:hypothetical protein